MSALTSAAAANFAGHVIHADDPSAKVYFDGGHSNWNSAAQQAAALKAACVTADADGVFTNVSNFEWTNDELYYGQQILAALGDSSLHLVIDTSRNGIGPGNTWCDPSGRALGLVPTANTGYSFVDAFLWVKPPGEADGCADKAGTFDPSLAAALDGLRHPARLGRLTPGVDCVRERARLTSSSAPEQPDRPKVSAAVAAFGLRAGHDGARLLYPALPVLYPSQKCRFTLVTLMETGMFTEMIRNPY